MLAYSIKNILELVPEALPLIKQATVDAELPLDSKDSVLASALYVQYMEKIAHGTVDVFALDKLNAAVTMHNLGDTVRSLSESMVKAANDVKAAANEASESYFIKVAQFEDACATMDIALRSELAQELYKAAAERNIVPSDDVVLYSGNGFLSKEAAVKALSVRYSTTKEIGFAKLASTIGRTPDAYLSAEVLVDLSNQVCELDKQAGLQFAGHNFYKEAFFVKEAAYKSALNVTVCGRPVPYEKIERVGREKIAQYIGRDFAQEMDGGPQNFKAVVETMPLDLQRVLSNLIKNV